MVIYIPVILFLFFLNFKEQNLFFTKFTTQRKLVSWQENNFVKILVAYGHRNHQKIFFPED